MKIHLRAVSVGAALALAATIVLATPAHAQQGDPAARFAEAQGLYEKGSYADALAKLGPLAEETNSPNVLLYVARTLRELGWLTEAYDAMQVAVRVSTERAVGEPKYAPTRDAAVAELAVLGLKVSHVVVAIADAPEGARVLLDRQALTPNQVGSAVTVTPGDHVVELEVPSAETIRRTITIAAGESKTIAIAAKEAAPAPPAVDSSRGGELRTVGFIVGGVGAASLLVGVVTGLMSNGEFSSLEDECGTSRCTSPSAADTIDSGKSLETVANITLIGGVVLVAAAVPLVIFGGPSSPAGTASVSASPAGAALRWQAAF